MYSRKTAKIVHSREADYSRRLHYLPITKAKGKDKRQRQDKKAFFLTRTRMYQVGTRYLGNCCTSYVYMSLRVLTLVRIPFTLPYLTDLLGTYLGGRRGEARQNEKGRFYVRNGEWIFFLSGSDKMK